MQRIVIIVALLVSTSLVVLAQDDQSPTLGVAGILTDEATVEQSMKADEGMHLYAFEGAANAEVSIEMQKSGGKIDPLLVVFAKDGSILAVDDDGGDDLNAATSVVLPRQDAYFVLAATLQSLYLPGNKDDLDGKYRLSIVGAADSAPEDGLDAQTLGLAQIQPDSSLSGSISTQRPFFLAWLEVQDSLTIDITTSSSEVDTLLYVFDAEGQRVAVDDDSGADGTSAAVTGLTLDEPGQYLIVITSFGYHAAEERGLTGGSLSLAVVRR